MASRHNSEYMAHDDSTNKSDSPYFQNNGYPAFGVQMPNGQQHTVNNQSWNYQPGRLDLAQNPPASAYQGWHDAPQHLNFAPNVPSDNHDHLYSGNFHDGSAEFRGASYVPPPTFDSSQSVQYDNSLMSRSNEADQSYGMQRASYSDQSLPSATISPGALQNHVSQFLPSSSSVATQATQPSSKRSKSSTPKISSQNSSNPSTGAGDGFKLPNGQVSGNFVIVDKATLDQVVKSAYLHNFVSIGNDVQDVSITKTTLPPYYPRKSRNEIKKMLASDSKLAGKIAKKPSKKGKSTASKAASGSGQAGSPKRARSQSSTDDSSEESGSESEDELVVQAPLPPTRPTSAKEAVRYDSIKALWRDPAKTLSTEEIRKGLADFWEVVRTIRDRWKSDASAAKDAEDAKKMNELPFLKERVSDQRVLFENALKAAMEHSHREILENLGLNSPFVLALSQFLQDRAKDLDYNGSFSVTILELLSKCTSITEGILEKTMLGKILPRFVKRGDEHVSKLAKKIPELATAASKRKKEAAKSGASNATNTKEAKAADPADKLEPSVTGVKRARSSEGEQEQPSKRIVPEGSKAAPAVKKAPGVSEVKVSTTPATAVSQPKEKHVIAKPSGFFSSLHSAKRPATAPKPPSSATSTTQKPTSENNVSDQKPSSTASSAPQPKPAFSFAETMANLTKPKEPETVTKKEESLPPETSEERTKRLRKEERRKLRVKFKPEGSLVDIRYFTHDPEEELGHDENQVRDVGDLDSEGRMFKLKHQEDMMDLDDDEDEDPDEPMGVDFSKPYPPLVEINFSNIVPQDERERNYEPHGGGLLKPDCPERWLQERREANTLLVVYSQSSEIPSSPKEPTEEEHEEESPPKIFGDPPENIKSRVSRLQASASFSPPPIAPAKNTAPPPALSAIFDSLKVQNQQASYQEPTQSQQFQQQPQTAPQPQPQPPPQTSQKQMTDLEKIFGQYGVNQQQTQQPVQQVPQQQQQQPSTSQYQSLANQFASFTQQGQYQPQAQTYQVDQPANMPSMANLSSILASLQQSGQLSQFTNQSSNFQADATSYGQHNQQQNFGAQNFQPVQQDQQAQQQASFPYENEERKHWRESGGDSESNDSRGFSKRQKTWQKAGKYSGPSSHIGPQGKPLPFKVVQCKYWKEGRCRKGDGCTFLHEE